MCQPNLQEEVHTPHPSPVLKLKGKFHPKTWQLRQRAGKTKFEVVAQFSSNIASGDGGKREVPFRTCLEVLGISYMISLQCILYMQLLCYLAIRSSTPVPTETFLSRLQ
jgi:hypothetical protein